MISEINSLRRAINESGSVVALTGAGISAESGIPTFRGAGGLWRNFRPEELATPQAFARDPRLVWEWYDWRRGVISQAQPNAGHLGLAALEHKGSCSFSLVTQNVDGLHDRAGSRDVLKLHGDIWEMRCTACGAVTGNDEVPLPQLPPYCPCGGVLRPNVVWFGESLPSDVWKRAVQVSSQADVLLLIGTSAVVYPAASLVEAAHRQGTRVAVINPNEAPLDGLAEWTLRGPAGEILPRVVE